MHDNTRRELAELIGIPDPGRDWMASREVADLAGKRHACVLRDIRRLRAHAQARCHFEPAMSVEAGRSRPCFCVSLPGVMGLMMHYDLRTRVRFLERVQKTYGREVLDDMLASCGFVGLFYQPEIH